MNDLNAILGQIEADAQNAREEILAAARREADQIRATGKEKAEAESQAILEDADRQVRGIHQQAQSQAGIEARNLLLAARRRVMDKAFVRAMELLTAMGEKEKAAFYAGLIEQNLEGKAELVLCSKDAAVGQQVLKLLGEKAGQITLSKTQGDFAGGFILRQGNIETNCTFEVLVDGIKEQVEPEVAAILFQ